MASLTICINFCTPCHFTFPLHRRTQNLEPEDTAACLIFTWQLQDTLLRYHFLNFGQQLRSFGSAVPFRDPTFANFDHQLRSFAQLFLSTFGNFDQQLPTAAPFDPREINYQSTDNK
jgi:hypothetical protein